MSLIVENDIPYHP